MPSLTEENYLKAIYHLSEDGTISVATNDLADAMKTKAASATDMVKKLAAKKFISYKKYYGVSLTAKGKSAALTVVRKHRLWETFLVQKLDFSWDEVHEVAEQLEHIQSTRLIAKLDDFLGYPKTDPHGDPIPDNKGNLQEQHTIDCNHLPEGQQAVITGVRDSDSALLKLLDRIGARPGKKIKILGREAYDESTEAVIDGQKVFLSKEVSQNILVLI